MLTAILPVISLSVSLARPAAGASDEIVTSPRAAQVRLAEVLAEADAIHRIRSLDARGGAHTIAFAVDHDGISLRAIATTRARGEVISLTITPTGPALGDLGGLSWLSPELAEAIAITRVTVARDGAVTLTTSDDRSYRALPGHGAGSNTAVEARWTAAWDQGAL